MMTFITKAFGSIIVRRILMAVTFTAVGYFGITKLVSSVGELLHKAEQHDEMLVKLNKANQSLADQAEEHKANIARLEADRDRIDQERKDIQKRAFIEAGKFKKLLSENADVQNWNSLPVPADVQLLRDQRYNRD